MIGPVFLLAVFTAVLDRIAPAASFQVGFLREPNLALIASERWRLADDPGDLKVLRHSVEGGAFTRGVGRALGVVSSGEWSEDPYVHA